MDVAKLLKEAGIESTPETLAKATESINAAEAAAVLTETTGLKAKNEELKGEKVAAKEAEKAAKVAADEATEAKLKADGKTAELKEFYDKQKDEALAESNRLNAELLAANAARDLATTRGKFGNSFLHATDADLYLEKMVKTGEDGKSTYHDLSGNIVADDEKSFGDWLGKQDSLKHVLKAPSSNGGGGNGDGEPLRPAGKQEAFDSLLNKKDKTRAESLELSKLGNELKAESLEAQQGD